MRRFIEIGQRQAERLNNDHCTTAPVAIKQHAVINLPNAQASTAVTVSVCARRA